VALFNDGQFAESFKPALCSTDNSPASGKNIQVSQVTSSMTTTQNQI